MPERGVDGDSVTVLATRPSQAPQGRALAACSPPPERALAPRSTRRPAPARTALNHGDGGQAMKTKQRGFIELLLLGKVGVAAFVLWFVCSMVAEAQTTVRLESASVSGPVTTEGLRSRLSLRSVCRSTRRAPDPRRAE